MQNTIDCLNYGEVELISSMGEDLSIVQAAQSSFSNFSTEYNEREQKILRSLMREKHGVPFEHVSLTYRLKMPIFVARQLVKHRMSSWSEHSARYSLFDIEYYLPEIGEVRTQSGKPMEYRFETAEPSVAEEFIQKLDAWSAQGTALYQWAIDNGIAREQARMFIPINAYTTITWTLNVRSLLNVLALRNDSHAQGETREYASAMEKLAWSVIPDTLAAFHEFGRIVP